MLSRKAFETTLIALLGSFMLASAAHAEDRLAVLGLRATSGDDALARNLTGSLREDAARIPGWSLEPAKVSLDQLMLISGCDEPDEACLAGIARSLGVDQILSGTVRRGKAESGGGHDYRVELFIFDVSTGRVENRADLRIPRTKTQSQDLAAIAQTEIAAFAGQEAPVADAASAPGEPARKLAQSSGNQKDQSGGARPVHWWPAAASYSASALFLGLTAWSWASINAVQNDPDFQNARVTAGPGVSDICAANYRSTDPNLDSLCATADRHETLQWVFLSAGLVSAGVGTWMLVRYRKGKSKPESRAAHWQLSPLAGRREGGLAARLKF
jgi:hypothetical protein